MDGLRQDGDGKKKSDTQKAEAIRAATWHQIPWYRHSSRRGIASYLLLDLHLEPPCHLAQFPWRRRGPYCFPPWHPGPTVALKSTARARVGREGLLRKFGRDIRFSPPPSLLPRCSRCAQRQNQREPRCMAHPFVRESREGTGARVLRRE